MTNPVVEVTFPSGATKRVYLLRLLVRAQNAEFKAKHGMFLPGVGKQHPTVKALREEYEMPPGIRTWEQAGTALRHFYTELNGAYMEAVSNAA